MQSLEVPKSTGLPAEETFSNHSADTIFQRLRAGNTNQKHTSCREASPAGMLDVFINVGKAQEAFKYTIGEEYSHEKL